ncbi:MAG: hypothetical protein IJT13_02935, partial [Bacteroidaceae bacterium]|nr:hypothetical protein [Bacteroidaceae bacterium]
KKNLIVLNSEIFLYLILEENRVNIGLIYVIRNGCPVKIRQRGAYYFKNKSAMPIYQHCGHII